MALIMYVVSYTIIVAFYAPGMVLLVINIIQFSSCQTDA